MQVDRTRFLAIAFGLAACHQSAAVAPAPQAKPAAATTTVALLSAASPPPAAAPNDPCSKLAAENDAILSSPTGTCTTAPEDDSGDPDALAALAAVAAEEPAVRATLAAQSKNTFFHGCHRGAKGTWAMVVDQAALSTPTGEGGTHCGWSVSYNWTYTSDSSAALRDGIHGRGADFTSFNDETSDASGDRVFDYDNDGRDELIYATSDWANGGGSSVGVVILKTDGRTITPYPVGFSYNRVVDADDDGRPDLTWDNYLTTGTCGLTMDPPAGPPLLLHSLADGTFSRTDEVARRWARTQCLPPAEAAEAAKNRGYAEDCTLDSLCLRMWGQTTAQVRRAANASCEDCNKAAKITELSTWKPPFTPLDKRTPQPFPPPPIPSTSAP